MNILKHINIKSSFVLMVILSCVLTIASIYKIALNHTVFGMASGIPLSKGNGTSDEIIGFKIMWHMWNVFDPPPTILPPTPPPCKVNPEALGPVPVVKEPLSWENLTKFINNVEIGGRWRPKNCTRENRIAIISPYRDRDSNLRMFLRHIHSFLQTQLLDYGIYIIEQDADSKFNRGMLMNIGFVEALKRFNYSCFVFSDVDLLPENTKNMYDCPEQPRHLSVAPDVHGYKLFYATLFGGVENFRKEQYQKINGFSNKYFGWGGEDDDLYKRLNPNGYKLIRPPIEIGRYTMSKHTKILHRNPKRINLLKRPTLASRTDGLNSLKYDIVKEVEYPLYTLISVRINETVIMTGT